MARRLPACPPRQRDPRLPAGRLPDRRRGSPTTRRHCPRLRRALLLLRRHGQRRPVRSRLLRAHVVPANEQGDRFGIVDGLNGHGGGGRMERARLLHDLSDDRKAGDRSGREECGPLRQIDRIQGGLGDDEVGIARLAAPRERDDEVGDRPSLLGREAVGERRHRRAVEPRAHRPEDVLACRPAPEGPGVREVGRADRLAEVVRQRRRRRSVAQTEVAVALQAAGLLVQLLPELDGLCRGCRPARKLHGLGGPFGVREVGREGGQEVGEIRHFLVGQVRPGGHRGVRHAAPDDVDEVLMGRECSVGSRPDLEPAAREVAWPGVQVRGGVAYTVPLLAVALRTVLEIEGLARLPLRLGPDVGTLRAQRRFHRAHRPGTHNAANRTATDPRGNIRREITGGSPGREAARR